MSQDQGTSRTYEIIVRATPDRVWQALTEGNLTRQYYFGASAESDWRRGSAVVHRAPDGTILQEGEVLEADPPRRLVTTFKPTWAPAVAGAAPSTVSWEIEPMGEGSKLTLTHAGFDQPSFEAGNMHLGWVQTLSSLKSLLETGQPLNVLG